ncbi:MAG: hypothetical protein AB8B88_01070 [Devosiaceae bacterium]
MSLDAALSRSKITLPEKPWPRALVISALFLIAGPPIAGLVAGISLALAAMVGSDTSAAEALVQFLPRAFVLSFSGAFLAYSLGLIPAIIIGAVIAWHEGWRGPVTGFSAVLLGMAIGALYYMVSEFAGLKNADFGAMFNVIICVVPAYLLSRVTRFWGRDDPAALIAGPVNT